MRPSELSHGRRWRNGLGGGPATRADRGTGRPGQPLAEQPWYPLTIAVWVICILVTAALLWAYLPFGFPNRPAPGARLVDACIALLVAYLLHNRFLRGWRLQDWLLTEAMVLLAFAGLGLTFLLEEVLGVRDGRLNVWLPLVVRAGGAVLVLAAALSGARTQSLRRWTLAAPPCSSRCARSRRGSGATPFPSRWSSHRPMPSPR